MRVIAGWLGGRLFDSPHSHKTHPMSDKARGALFNILGDIKGMTVLDPFAGTGAISFEAISRGASSTLAIEADRPAQKIIAANIASLGLTDRVKLIGGMANSWLGKNKGTMFDIVVCDPPYEDLQYDLVERLERAVKPDGIFVVSWPKGGDLPRFKQLTLIDQRGYGDMQLVFYRKIG
jgi:16S rRNA (guanine966-N2)-methyltransferase